ncbi:hypothetical protein L3X38_036807 [Prunus dulcis]|uniref:Uncharacterized protein n=1 Tax=Prunus dulcis TaxID=3755 RepID=A0AAD4V1W9_PRUDU|nr:hypothetical protein L3X38_036807 [Prunus dulcis]
MGYNTNSNICSLCPIRYYDHPKLFLKYLSYWLNQVGTLNNWVGLGSHHLHNVCEITRLSPENVHTSWEYNFNSFIAFFDSDVKILRSTDELLLLHYVFPDYEIFRGAQVFPKTVKALDGLLGWYYLVCQEKDNYLPLTLPTLERLFRQLFGFLRHGLVEGELASAFLVENEEMNGLGLGVVWLAGCPPLVGLSLLPFIAVGAPTFLKQAMNERVPRQKLMT